MSNYDFLDFFNHPPRCLRDNQLLHELKIHRTADDSIKKIRTLDDLQKFARNPKSKVVQAELLDIFEQFQYQIDEIAFSSLRH